MTLIIDNFRVENTDSSRWSFDDMGEHLSICHQGTSDLMQAIVSPALAKNIVKVSLKFRVVFEIRRTTTINKVHDVKTALHFWTTSLLLRGLQTNLF